MTLRAKVAGGSSHPQRLREDPGQTAGGSAREDMTILSFSLLLALVASGFVISLGLAEANPALTNALSTLLN